LGIIATLCSDTAIQRPASKQHRTFIANELVDKASNLGNVVVASLLAKRLGFPPDQQAKLETEARNDATALTAHNPWIYTDEGSRYTRGSSNFRCNTVLGYDELWMPSRLPTEIGALRSPP